MNRALPDFTRRQLLGHVSTGLMGVGLSQLMGREVLASAPGADLGAWQPGIGAAHFAPKAKRVLQIFCPGAASHMDLWDHKPMLEKMDGKPMPGEENLV